MAVRFSVPHLLLLALVSAYNIANSAGSSVVEKFYIEDDHQLHHAQAKLDDQTMCVFSYAASGGSDTGEAWEILLAKQDDVYKCIIDVPGGKSDVQFIQFAASILEKEIIVAEAFDSEGEAMLQNDEYEVNIDSVLCIMGHFRGGLTKVNIKSH